MTTPSIARGAVAAAGLLLAAAPASAQTGLTIYNDGRVLVRRAFPVAVGAGLSEVRLQPGALDPSSLLSLDPEVQIVESHYDAAVDERSVLRRAVGRTLTFETGGKSVQATLLGVDPERWRLADGAVTFARPGILRVPEELVTTDPQLELKLRAAKARSQASFGWFTDGTAWSAAYAVVLQKSGMARVEGSAVLVNGALRADSAEIQLVAGSPGRAAPSPKAYMSMRAAEGMVADAAPYAGAGERVGDLRVYPLPGRWSLRPGQTSTIALFEPMSAKITRTYEVGGVLPWYGPLMPRGDESEVPVEVRYTLERPRGSEFGERALPAGTARVYDQDAQGRLQLVGEASTGHSAAGKDLVLATGTAFDLTARRVQTNYVTKPAAPREKGGATAAYAVTLANAGDEPVVIDVMEERGGEWSVVRSSVPAEKLSSTRTRFRVKVPARGETTLTYTVQLVW